jgi:hypothetical protein
MKAVLRIYTDPHYGDLEKIHRTKQTEENIGERELSREYTKNPGGGICCPAVCCYCFLLCALTTPLQAAIHGSCERTHLECIDLSPADIAGDTRIHCAVLNALSQRSLCSLTQHQLQFTPKQVALAPREAIELRERQTGLFGRLVTARCLVDPEPG